MDSLLLAYNRIDRIDGFERVPCLTCLDLHNNKLAELPDQIAHLKKLKTLKISNNDLSDLNPRLALLP